ncbi:MAG: hypothetical protein ACTHMY_09800 [Solirubrobacteraceae bacterium]
MRALLAVIGMVAIVAIVGPATANARTRPPIRSCGQIVFRVPHTGQQKFLYTESIDARRMSCGRARAFVRSYERLGDEGKLPDRASGKTHRSVLVFYQWTRPYRVSGFVCRSMALPNALVNAGRVTCGAPAGLVTWHETGHSHSD